MLVANTTPPGTYNNRRLPSPSTNWHRIPIGLSILFIAYIVYVLVVIGVHNGNNSSSTSTTSLRERNTIRSGPLLVHNNNNKIGVDSQQFMMRNSFLRRNESAVHPPCVIPTQWITTMQSLLKVGGKRNKRPRTITELATWLAQQRSSRSRLGGGESNEYFAPLLFDQMFEVEDNKARVFIPTLFEDRVRSMFAAYPGGTSSNLDFVQKQTVTVTRNKFTEESSMFNELRRYRPGYQEKLSAELDEKVRSEYESGKGSDVCDFCSGNRTAEDIFGRMESTHCYTASNVAKYETWHALVISRTHNPIDVTVAGVVDYLDTAARWFHAAHQQDQEAIFPHLMWDAGSRGSASQTHQHMQLILKKSRYLNKVEVGRIQAASFQELHPSKNYWAELVKAHVSLGLGLFLHSGTVAIISHVCPIKEREVLVVSLHPPSSSDNGQDKDDEGDEKRRRRHHFAEAIHLVLRTLIDDVGTRSFSLAVTFEPLVRSSSLRSVPFGVARIVDRGSPLDKRSDVGAMEFFGANNVGADPYHIMPLLAARVNNHR